MDEQFILKHKITETYVWYVCELKYYDFPNSDWILSCTQSQKRKDAMEFCEKKAERIAEILLNQVDEEGYSHAWKVVKV